MTRLAALVLALLVALVTAVACGAEDAGQGAADPAVATVAVEASGCRLRPTHAVGTVVEDELVLTVAHAVAGEEQVQVRTRDGRLLAARVAAIDTTLDAALLRVDGLGLDPLPRRAAVSAEPVRLLVVDDDEVHAQQAEIRRRVRIRTSDIYRRGEHLRPGLEVAGEVRAGDSGGGVVGADGSLVGMIWARSRADDGRAWATRIEVVEPMLAAVAAGDPPAPAECSR